MAQANNNNRPNPAEVAAQIAALQARDQENAEDNVEAARARQEAAAASGAQLARRFDECRPGGDYIVNGVRVDANGKPIEDHEA